LKPRPQLALRNYLRMTMTKLLLAKSTEDNLVAILGQPSHSLLVVGPNASGKYTLAYYIAGQILGLSDDQLSRYPYFHTILPIEGSISIDQIREFKKFLVLKTTGKGQVRRVTIIDRADLMTGEAQNALLKVLEEPPSDTLIILTSLNQDRLKATIVSRCQILIINKPSLSAVLDYFRLQGYSDEDVQSKFMLSNGAIGLLSSLLDPESEQSLTIYVNDAKQLLKQSYFDKLLRVDELAKNREALADWLYALRRVSQAALNQAVKNNQVKLTRYWLRSLAAIIDCEKDLIVGANLKLLLTKLFDEIEYN
jgi:DNA polymerase III delta prime subunit